MLYNKYLEFEEKVFKKYLEDIYSNGRRLNWRAPHWDSLRSFTPDSPIRSNTKGPVNQEYSAADLTNSFKGVTVSERNSFRNSKSAGGVPKMWNS
jgi:hypothetical protein